MAASTNMCKFNLYGHCKFGEKCEKLHTDKTCKTFPCHSTECLQRHPPICKFFERYGRCKFSDKCSYLHVSNYDKQDKLEDEIKSLKEEIKQLRIQNNLLASLANRLNFVEGKIVELEDKKTRETEKVLEFDRNNVEGKCPICDENCFNSEMLESHMNSHSEIVQLDGNVNEDENSTDEDRLLNEYEIKDPNNPHEAPYFFSDDELEDFIVQCKVCGKECDGKISYNTHVSIYHPCNTCQKYNGSDIHHCPYRDFFLPD